MNIIQWDRDYGASRGAALPQRRQLDRHRPRSRRLGGNASCRRCRSVDRTAPPAAAPRPAGCGHRCSDRRQRAEVRVVTDVLDIDISLQGGDLLRADLRSIRRTRSRAARRCACSDRRRDLQHRAQRTARRRGARRTEAHRDVHRAATEYRLAQGDQELRVPLTWTDGQGVTVTKTFVFRPRPVRRRRDLRRPERARPPWRRASYAQFARHVIAEALDVRRRELRVPRAGDL